MHYSRGVLKIAEVVSRFNGVEKFIADVSTFGFLFLSKVTVIINVSIITFFFSYLVCDYTLRKPRKGDYWANEVSTEMLLY